MRLLPPRPSYAICVGLNYPGTSAALQGCVNDAHDWAKELTGRGYQVRTLLEPTKAELVAELRGVVSRARWGSRVVFTYSGHGSWVPDRDGDEADGRDECLVLADYSKGRAGLLLDDEIQQIFHEAQAGVRSLVIPDSCHSGTMSRFMGGPSLLVQDAARRFLPPDNFLDGAALQAARQVQGLPPAGRPRPGPVLLSGCDDPEYSYDAYIGGRYRGAFTAAALDALPRARTVGGWHREIRKMLPSTRFPQTPQLHATPWQRRWSSL